MTTFRLTPGADRSPAIEALAGSVGGRVGLDAVLADLNRLATPVFAPGRLVARAFGWDREDDRSARWWPQGITTSADATDEETWSGRSVVVTTSYSKTIGGLNKGSRISVVDVSDEARPRYRHVLLADAALDQHGRPVLRPVVAHAGGVVWFGPWLFVAGTGKGVLVFHVDDVLPVDPRQPGLLGAGPGGVHGYGHRYVLPLRHALRAGTEEGETGLRYSFLSLDRDGAPTLLAGEYGRGSMTTRLIAFDLGADGRPAPSGRLLPPGVPQMQGAVLAHGRLHVTASNGRYGLGSLWVGAPGDLVRHRHALPVGPEDVCWWPSREELWSVTEYPRQRAVFVVDRSRLDDLPGGAGRSAQSREVR